jgi:hypothetical protein
MIERIGCSPKQNCQKAGKLPGMPRAICMRQCPTMSGRRRAAPGTI